MLGEDRTNKAANAIIDGYLQNKMRLKELELTAKGNEIWKQIVTNISILGSNQNTYNKRANTKEYVEFSIWRNVENLDKESFFLNAQIIPGSRNISQERKINALYSIRSAIKEFKYKNDGGYKSFINWIDDPSIEAKEILEFMYNCFPLISCKIARNIMMDLFHVKFTRGFLALDYNFERLGNYLNEKWKDPCKDEKKVLAWYEKYIFPKIPTTWEFDRAVYWSLQKDSKSDELTKLIVHNTIKNI